mgnify:CR=1 FL=1|tara:strand:+ start:11974 stop:13452 length:1479 start_codon:yes stop_codon:yes gene_type:complete
MSDNTTEYRWILVVGILASFSAAFGIGANDVANAFATSVGSKALSIRQACVLAVIGEFIGATFLGGEVVKTIRKGIADETYFADNPPLLMWGCLSVLIAVTFWLLLASRLEMPVSTTHSVIGGMIGMAIAGRGLDAVQWYKRTDEFPYAGGFVGVIISWGLSPIASALVSSFIFLFIRTFIFRSKNPFKRVIYIYPFFVALCVSIISMFMLMKGIKSSAEIKELHYSAKLGISLGIGVGISIILIPAYKIIINRINSEKNHAEVTAIENNRVITKENRTICTSLNVNIHEAVETDIRTFNVHKNAERFDPKTEAFFVYLQVFSAFFDSICHGSNDVANAVGPFATIFVVFESGIVSTNSDMDENKYWILGLGGLGISLGLLIYGYRILKAIGVKLAAITPSRGFSIEMGSSLIVIIGSYNKWPLSTTHCQVGATCGVALLDGVSGINKYVLLKTVFGWIITCFIVGILSASIFSIGAYAPSVHQTTCANFTN